jgi:hypothetical protein
MKDLNTIDAVSVKIIKKAIKTDSLQFGIWIFLLI